MAVLERPMKKLSFISGLVLIVSLVVACEIERIEAPSILPMDAEHFILTDSCGMATVEFQWFIRAVTDINVPVVRIAVKNIGSEPAKSIFEKVYAISIFGTIIDDGIITKTKEPLAPGETFEDVAFFIDLSSFSFIEKLQLEVSCFNN